jgi:hypothetical protein
MLKREGKGSGNNMDGMNKMLASCRCRRRCFSYDGWLRLGKLLHEEMGPGKSWNLCR